MANLYTTTTKPFSGSGQKAIVHDLWTKAGSDGATYHDIAVALEKDSRFKSRQSATRIAAYYLVILVKEGHLVHKDADAAYPRNERTSDGAVEATVTKDYGVGAGIVLTDEISNKRETVKF